MSAPLIAVWSPKGGVGKTFLAAGFALHLQRRCPDGAILVDLDAGKSDIPALLKISPRPSILDAAAGTGRLIRHPTGLSILAGPPRLVEEGMVTAELTGQVLDELMAGNQPVVADLSASLRDSTLVALERANLVLMVTTPDLLSIWACRRFVQEAELIGLNLQSWKLVVNQEQAEMPVPLAEVRDLIGLPLIGTVPDLPAMAMAVNRGMITALGHTNTEFAFAIHEMVNRFGLKEIPLIHLPGGKLETAKPVGLLQSLRRWWRSV
jgi:pilus assembly protein CpaE